jgi:hypothetical protein
MAITIVGKGVIANCDGLTDSAGGEWSEIGGGGIDYTTDVKRFGDGCIAGSYSNKSGWQVYDIGSGSELDFDTAGTEEGQFIYIWIHCPTLGLLETIANKGLAIRIGSGTGDYREYVIAGSNDSNGWAGGWRCFVVDIRIAGTVSDTGTLDLAAIRYIGVWIDAASLARGDNLFVDQIAVGTGVRTTGYSATNWAMLVDYCTAYASRAWGMLQEREGIYYAYGKIYIGDTAQTEATYFWEGNAPVIKFGTTEFWNGSFWVNSHPATGFSGVVVEDHASYKTDFQDGQAVGTEKGRDGTYYLGDENLRTTMDLYGGNNAAGVTKLWATQFRNLRGIISMGDDADHLFYSGVVAGCGQFDPVGAPKIRNCLFITTWDRYGPFPDGSALLWNADIDIKSCNFIANTDGTYDPHAIQHDVAGTFTYYGLLFSGNDYDIHFTPGTGDLIINAAKDAVGVQSDPATYDNDSSGSVTINNTVTHKLIGLKENTEITYTKKPTASVTAAGDLENGSRILIDTDMSWAVDEHKGRLLVLTLGLDAGRHYIVSNDETTLTLSEKMTETITNRGYKIYTGFVEVSHTEDVPSGGENSYQYSYTADQDVDVLIFHVDYEDIILIDALLGSSDQTIPITQIPDVNYFNPT